MKMNIVLFSIVVAFALCQVGYGQNANDPVIGGHFLLRGRPGWPHNNENTDYVQDSQEPIKHEHVHDFFANVESAVDKMLDFLRGTNKIVKDVAYDVLEQIFGPREKRSSPPQSSSDFDIFNY